MKFALCNLLILIGFSVIFTSCGADDASDPSPDGDADKEASDGDASDGDADFDADDDEDGEAESIVLPDAWSFPRLHTDGERVVDEFGRTVMLRGINIGGRAKLPPFLPWEGALDDSAFDDKLSAFMDFPEDWGMNCVRFTVFWEALEPVRGQVDPDYLDLVERQIDALAERGLYVFIDFHQDLFSRWLGGSGAPSWALEDPPAEPPVLDDKTWYMKVFADENVLQAFDRFWEDTDGIRGAYADTVIAVAERFADKPNVLGLDLMNEPNPGALGKQDPNRWYAERLIPFYKALATRIREIAPHFVVFVEPSGFEAGQSGGEETWSLEGLDNYIFAPHYYYPVQFVTGEYPGDLEGLREALGEKAARGTSLGAPVLLSEFGFRGSEGDTGKDENAGWFITDLYTILDERHMHATVWTHEVSEHYWNHEDCSFVNGDWTERTPRADALSRPYAPFTAGAPVRASYDATSRRFEYVYAYDSGASAPTWIRLPRRHYPQAPNVSLSFGRAHYVESLSLLVIDEQGGGTLPEDGAQQTLIIAPE